MTESIFGPLLSPWPLQQQIIAVYQVWAGEYLAEIERKEKLQPRTIPRPPAAASYHGGIDMLTWKRAELPKLIVVVEPTGQPERDASAGYSQWFEVEVGCIVAGTGGATIADGSLVPEDEARAYGSFYGAMAMLLVDHPPGLASDIFMVQSPRLSFPSPDERTVVQATTVFHVLVAPLKFLAAGPVQPLPAESPEYVGREEPWNPEPVVKTTHVTIQGEEL
jgi:hypothetical protein